MIGLQSKKNIGVLFLKLN